MAARVVLTYRNDAAFPATALGVKVMSMMAGLFPGPDAAALAAAWDRGEPFVALAPESRAAQALMGIAGAIRAALACRVA